MLVVVLVVKGSREQDMVVVEVVHMHLHMPVVVKQDTLEQVMVEMLRRTVVLVVEEVNIIQELENIAEVVVPVSFSSHTHPDK